MINKNNKIIETESGKIHTQIDDLCNLLYNKYHTFFVNLNKEKVKNRFAYFHIDYVKEIIYDDELVGFIAFDRFDLNVICIRLIYVLPEYRGKDIVKREFQFIKNHFNCTVCIDRPNRHLMNSLIKMGLAEELDCGIICSKILLYLPSFDETLYEEKYGYCSWVFDSHNEEIVLMTDNLSKLQIYNSKSNKKISKSFIIFAAILTFCVVILKILFIFILLKGLI